MFTRDGEVVPIVQRVTDGWIDLQVMLLTDLLAAGVQRLAGGGSSRSRRE
jgi:hypothetical protein